ncbi:hypothetical protein [Psychrobacter aquaticus]|uniref:Phage protein n=1 Tax=Psychrobacter aquaticus CMS 56 TaxID=1354303 RepID=U4T8Y5_9GAMM|nr:hypothetical protein [Psychrobacter aquaticus]ERL54948.1 hypothetical protein M917_2294 [Psychrobacter aquaticus CMS 56]
MLFELALSGIGGNTIHQVKSNLTMLEINQWAEYRDIRGSLNIGRRVEQAAANIIAMNINKELKFEDWVEPLEFMPHEDDVEIGFEEQLTD